MRIHDVLPQDIESIEIGTYSIALDTTDNPSPTSVYAAKFSLQFCAALAAVHRSASHHDFTETSLHEPAVRQLLPRIRVSVDEQCAANYPDSWGASVTIRANSGATYSALTDYPRGDYENPVDDSELIAKFRGLVQTHLQPAWISEPIARVLKVDEVTSMTGLFQGC